MRGTKDLPEHISHTRTGRPITMLEAIREALWEELERDPTVQAAGICPVIEAP